MGRVHAAADPLRRVCATALYGHRKRAKADRQELDYGLLDLERLARRTPLCTYCCCPLTEGTLSFDHATPLARVANYSLGNLAVCCCSCNSAKGCMDAGEFTRLLAVLRTFHPRSFGDVMARLRSGGRRYRGA